MSWKANVVIECRCDADGCAATHDFRDHSFSEARLQAATFGWRVRGRRCYCPDHGEEANKKASAA